MESFVKSTLGNSYRISIKNLLFRVPSVANQNINNREFFCSELVAKAYKHLGLLKTQHAAWDFMPSDFSKESTKLKLEGDARLTEEQIIMFNEKTLAKEITQIKKKLNT